MSKFMSSWAPKGNDHPASHVELRPAGTFGVGAGAGGPSPNEYGTTNGQRQNEGGEQQRPKPSTTPTGPSHGVDTVLGNQIYAAGGPPPSAYPKNYGQQQNGAGEQPRPKPSTTPTAPLMESHGVDTTTFGNKKYGAREQPQTNTVPKTGATANPASYDGDGRYPVSTPGSLDNQQGVTKKQPQIQNSQQSKEKLERANSRAYPPHQKKEKGPEIRSDDPWSSGKANNGETNNPTTNQIIRSPSMSIHSQSQKVTSRSKTEEKASAPAHSPASGPPQYTMPQASQTQSRTEVTVPQVGPGFTVLAWIVKPEFPGSMPWDNLAHNPNAREKPIEEPRDQTKEYQTPDSRLQREESKTKVDRKAQGTEATTGIQRVASKPRDETRQTNMQMNGTSSHQQPSGFDRKNGTNDSYNAIQYQVGKAAPITPLPAPNEPPYLRIPSHKESTLTPAARNEGHTYNNYQTSITEEPLPVREPSKRESPYVSTEQTALNDQHKYNNRQASSKVTATGATQTGQAAPQGATAASNQKLQDTRSSTPPPESNIQQNSQPAKPKCPCSIL